MVFEIVLDASLATNDFDSVIPGTSTTYGPALSSSLRAKTATIATSAGIDSSANASPAESASAIRGKSTQRMSTSTPMVSAACPIAWSGSAGSS